MHLRRTNELMTQQQHANAENSRLSTATNTYSDRVRLVSVMEIHDGCKALITLRPTERRRMDRSTQSTELQQLQEALLNAQEEIRRSAQALSAHPNSNSHQPLQPQPAPSEINLTNPATSRNFVCQALEEALLVGVAFSALDDTITSDQIPINQDEQ